jgi:dTDP-4-dehydrorhamnose reductase
VIETTVFDDERGFFFESWSAQEFARSVTAASFVEDNQSRSARGVLRGLHYQKLFHFTDRGVASGYDFAVAVRQCALDVDPKLALGAIVPIASEDYPTPARRPRFSLLDTRATSAAVGETPAHWRANLSRVLWEKLHG